MVSSYPTTIEDFESGDMSNWDTVDDIVVDSAQSHDGSFAARADASGFQYAYELDGTIPHAERGDQAEIWVRSSSNGDGGAGLIFGAQDTNDLYQLYTNTGNGDLVLSVVESGSSTELFRVGNATLSASTWYRLVLDWTTDAIVGRLFDSSGTPLLAGYARDTTYTSGGVGIITEQTASGVRTWVDGYTVPSTPDTIDLFDSCGGTAQTWTAPRADSFVMIAEGASGGGGGNSTSEGDGSGGDGGAGGLSVTYYSASDSENVDVYAGCGGGAAAGSSGGSGGAGFFNGGAGSEGADADTGGGGGGGGASALLDSSGTNIAVADAGGGGGGAGDADTFSTSIGGGGGGGARGGTGGSGANSGGEDAGGTGEGGDGGDRGDASDRLGHTGLNGGQEVTQGTELSSTALGNGAQGVDDEVAGNDGSVLIIYESPPVAPSGLNATAQ